MLVGSCHDAEIQQWNRPGYLSLDEARGRIARWSRRWRDEKAAIWAIALSADAKPIGLIGLADIDLTGGSAEYLYWLLPEGRGSRSDGRGDHPHQPVGSGGRRPASAPDHPLP
ncbi:GNAT family N-acetyltransferase [Streptomyces sp. NPDC059875]|uniref:GNAT family N-acetyltransferase n=1 Tax=unclassified Streptomyces TaxID=2593676 RepID=UPI00365D02E4